MSKFLKRAAAASVAAVAGFSSIVALSQTYGVGRVATDEEIAAWDIDVRPDGVGLPKGSGSVLDGEELYLGQCASCHGDFGEGAGRWPVLAGGFDTLDSEDPVKTVGSYWPYTSTVFDYVHRAMPFGAAQTLTDDEVYAITAYILFLNDVITDEEFVLSNENFTTIVLPNVDGFIADDRGASPVMAVREPCMSDCKESVEITMRARILDVTPDDGSEDGAAQVPETPAAPAIVINEELAELGAKEYKRKCSSCHQIGDGARNLTGPVLTGIVDAPIGAVEGFRYSKTLVALGEEGAVWSEEALGAFLESPRKFAKGTTMPFRGVRDAEDRAAIIEFLKKASQ